MRRFHVRPMGSSIRLCLGQSGRGASYAPPVGTLETVRRAMYRSALSAAALCAAVGGVAVVPGTVAAAPYFPTVSGPSEWGLVETRDKGRTLVVGPVEAVSPCVAFRGSATETPSAVTVTLWADRSACATYSKFDEHHPVAKVRLAEPLSGREILGAERKLDPTGFLPSGTFAIRAVEKPPGLIGLRVSEARVIIKPWKLKLKIHGPTTARAYVTSQRGPRKRKPGDRLTIRTTKQQPRQSG